LPLRLSPPFWCSELKEYEALTAVYIWSVTSFRLWGKLLDQRLVTQFARENVSQVEALPTTGDVIIVRADAVIDQPLVKLLRDQKDFVLHENPAHGEAVVAAHVDVGRVPEIIAAFETGSDVAGALAPEEVKADFWKALRKRETPYAARITKTNKEALEWRMFMGTYKGATDIVTKHVWPVPAFYVTRFLALLGVTPNMVTSVAAVLTVLAFWLFWRGDFAWGLLAAWGMTFLDTVDGKLARTTLTSSKWGDLFDHGIDVVHPPFWYYAWAIGLGAWGIAWSAETFWWVVGIILGGYVLQRAIEGTAMAWLGIEIHIWRKIDTWFRSITARRNPNLLILTASLVFQRPDLGLIAVAAWTGLCFVLHAIQMAQAASARAAKGSKLESWMTKAG
jgi:phosphatidylglycerophosphate synthase